MARRPRRSTLRSAGSFLLLVAAAIALAQLAGVAGSGGHGRVTALEFDGGHQAWLVRTSAAARSAAKGRAIAGADEDRRRLDRAARNLGGGSTGRTLPGGWREVTLGTDVSAAQAEAAFTAAGAVDIEPALPRLPYAAPLAAPMLAKQWALRQASDHDVDGVEAWQRTTGAGSIVAVIDTGVDASHPDLAGRVLAGRDFSGAGTPATVDRVGHGTNVASIVAASGSTIAGIAPDARILPLKVFADSAAGFSMTGYLEAIRYAADAGADVINISLGCGGTPGCFSQAELDALTYAEQRGVLIVAAAGNGSSAGYGYDNDDAETPDYPSGYDIGGLVSVTSSTRLGAWSTWANYGREQVDLAAPGESILAAVAGGGHASATGTSFAAPLAAGAAALVRATSPSISPVDLRARLVGTTAAQPSLAARTVSGGVLNADGAVRSYIVAGGGPAVAAPTPLAPRAGVRISAPPLLRWRLPAGWRTTGVRLRRVGSSHDRRLPATQRAFHHPTSAWRSGTYRWQVVARSPSGSLATTRWRTYRLAPRLGAWVTSGRFSRSGRRLHLRVGYAATEPRARISIVVRRGRTVLHRSGVMTQTAHLRSAGSPRRGWFTHVASLRRGPSRGQRVVVEVRVSAGGSTITRRFRARVT